MSNDHIIYRISRQQSRDRLANGGARLRRLVSVIAAALQLEVDDVSKTFPGHRALRNVSLRVQSGEVRGLIGANGSGKSTLVKILAGVYEPDARSGGISVGGQPLRLPVPPAEGRRAGLRFVHQDLGLVERRPVLENLILGRPFLRRRGFIDWTAERRIATALLAQFDVSFDLDDLVGNLSRAQQSLVAIMRALGGDDSMPMRVLVLDEPTVGLPPDESRMVLEAAAALSRRGIGVILVSHALDDVARVCNTLTVLRDGAVVLDGEASTPRHDVVGALTGERVLRLGAAPPSPPPSTLDAHDIALDVRNLRAPGLLGVSLQVARGEVVGVAGDLDSGVATLLAAIYGDVPAQADALTSAGRAVRPHSPRSARHHGISYIPADRVGDALIAGMTLRENLSGAELHDVATRLRVRHRHEHQQRRHLAERFGIQPPRLQATIESFSGGNQQKAVLARWLRTEPKVVLIDQPTQGVDVVGKADIHAHIRDSAGRGCAFLISSAEHEELAALCSRVIVLQRGVATAELRTPEITPAAISAAMFARDAVAGNDSHDVAQQRDATSLAAKAHG
ncbi:MAG TPA: sugar ABC transporter ATP-binding protein [Candidatus Dormibacteraeota bacterium]|nr:sugar ABC transporter ATP-binding protein [Candidatus Dormibacteraeota bacterium]